MDTPATRWRGLLPLLMIPALALASCAGGGAGGPGGNAGADTPAPVTDTADRPDDPAKSPTPTRGDSDSSDGSTRNDDITTVDADAIQFNLNGTEMLCWTEDTATFGCQAAADWAASEGPSPASVVLFDLEERDITAMQANAPVTSWEIQRVRGAGLYRLDDIVIDLRKRERLTFTVAGGDTSGWLSLSDYGWD